MKYCSTLQCKTDKPLVFCHNCSLRREQDGSVNTNNMEEVTIDNEKFVKGDNSVYLGSMNEFLSQAQGRDYWLIATDLLIDLRIELKKEV